MATSGATPVATAAQRPLENPVPAAMPEPLAASSAPMAPAPQLSDASRDILSKFPSKINSAAAIKTAGKQKLSISRMSPDIKAIVAPDPKVESYDAAGLSIKVQRPGLDTNFELNRAYSALTAGDSQVAIETYKNILSTEPKNEDALFGLAATYHRIGDLEHARPYYAQLLKVNPNHREGLNNFLALVSDEAPQEALAELERLEQRNPDFSPIPAQEATVLNKLGYADQARDKMLRAIELAPDNLTYKYNLAVMLDKQGNYVDAGALYRLLIDASLKGQKIPASLEVIQTRLNFITTAAAAHGTVGG
jgi:Flp pilus assembly protein TadD